LLSFSSGPERDQYGDDVMYAIHPILQEAHPTLEAMERQCEELLSSMHPFHQYYLSHLQMASGNEASGKNTILWSQT